MIDYLEQWHVSRETREKLQLYQKMLELWQQKINLISSETVNDIWPRHFIDSAQLYPYFKDKNINSLIDIGSGAGFPGMVLVIMGIPNITLIEHDKRKAAFLKEVARETGTAIKVFANSVENYHEKPQIITCRAWAPLLRLFNQTKHLVSRETEFWLLKSENIDLELTEATTKWQFNQENFPSITDSRGTILHCWTIQDK